MAYMMLLPVLMMERAVTATAINRVMIAPPWTQGQEEKSLWEIEGMGKHR